MHLTTHETTVVERALELALTELHNLIATCPNVHEYADDIAAIRDEIEQTVELLTRTRNHLGRFDDVQA